MLSDTICTQIALIVCCINEIRSRRTVNRVQPSYAPFSVHLVKTWYRRRWMPSSGRGRKRNRFLFLNESFSWRHPHDKRGIVTEFTCRPVLFSTWSSIMKMGIFVPKTNIDKSLELLYFNALLNYIHSSKYWKKLTNSARKIDAPKKGTRVVNRTINRSFSNNVRSWRALRFDRWLKLFWYSMKHSFRTFNIW